MKIMITSTTQGFLNTRSITLATGSSTYIHGAIWLFSSRKYGFHFKYLYVSMRLFLLREMLKKDEKNFFLEIVHSYFMSFSMDHSWSLQSQWRATKPSTRQNKNQTACPYHQPCICRIKMFIQLQLFFPNF